MKKLNVAIIGQGRSGRDIHGAFFRREPDQFQVVAVVDALEDRRARAREEYGCDAYATYQELFGRTDVDLVVNSTFSYMHSAITVDLLNHGFNVLVEKPAAQTAAQVQEMIDAAKKNNRMVAVFQQSHFAPYFEQVQEVIASGKLGRIVQINIAFNGYSRRWDWQCSQAFGGGNLYNTGPHPLEQALTLLNYWDDMPGVFCKMDNANCFGDAEDYVKLILTAPERPLIDLEISSCDAYPSCTYKLQGTRGGLTGTMTQMDWKYYCAVEAPKQKLILEPLAKADGTPAYCGEKLEWTSESWTADGARTFTYSVKKYYDTIRRHLLEGAPLTVTMEQVKRQIAVIEECHRQNPMPKAQA